MKRKEIYKFLKIYHELLFRHKLIPYKGGRFMICRICGICPIMSYVAIRHDKLNFLRMKKNITLHNRTCNSYIIDRVHNL